MELVVPVAIAAPPIDVPDRMDPYSTFILTVRIMRKGNRFEGAWVSEWPIDFDTTNFKDFVDDISDKYPWGIDETVKVHVAKHECASTRRDEKVKRASKAWICEKVMG
ncbi:hypothetical protein E2562_038830 [Oryza meyeriana var. granulata]|uniref:Uncharacterized protein n=1 Tax=Oryza meyeriana var. granulata TaxID=110450 RepID=A0A6G1CM71_9ORYZ|nr:hypothetical protein E2562_038830 [Oryza meyeriana var. granulata]